MKKISIILISFLLLLTACSTSFTPSNDAERIALEIKDILLIDSKIETESKIELSSVDINVIAEYYIEAYLSVQGLNFEDDQFTQEQKRYLPAFEAFFYILLDKIDNEHSDIHVAHVGYNDDKGYNGIFVMEFKTDFNLDQEIIDAINQDFNNNLEYILVHNNILVIMDDGFMSDNEANMKQIDLIVKNVLGDNE